MKPIHHFTVVISIKLFISYYILSSPPVSEPPLNLTTVPSNTTVSVMWSPPADANGVVSTYLISLFDSMSILIQNQTVVSSTLTVEFTGLAPFTNYTVSVRAFTGDGIEGMSAMKSFMTNVGGT